MLSKSSLKFVVMSGLKLRSKDVKLLSDAKVLSGRIFIWLFDILSSVKYCVFIYIVESKYSKRLKSKQTERRVKPTSCEKLKN